MQEYFLASEIEDMRGRPNQRRVTRLSTNEDAEWRIARQFLRGVSQLENCDWSVATTFLKRSYRKKNVPRVNLMLIICEKRSPL